MAQVVLEGIAVHEGTLVGSQSLMSLDGPSPAYAGEGPSVVVGSVL